MSGNRLIFKIWTLFFGIALIITLFHAGCSSSDSPKTRVESLAFEVNDSLLGDTIAIAESGLYVVAPATYHARIDTVPEQFQSLQDHEFPSHDLIAVYYDPTAIAELQVAVIRDLNLATDTSLFMANYRKMLSDAYGDSAIKTGDFMVNDVLVKNFLMMDSGFVQFKLLCLTYGKPAAEIEYITYKQDYPKLLKSIESSMGTIQTITKEVYE
jgi:hypothetical protein